MIGRIVPFQCTVSSLVDDALDLRSSRNTVGPAVLSVGIPNPHGAILTVSGVFSIRTRRSQFLPLAVTAIRSQKVDHRAPAHSGELPRKLPLGYPLGCRPKECFKQTSGSGQSGG